MTVLLIFMSVIGALIVADRCAKAHDEWEDR